MKQLTISLDDDLYAMARDHAAALRTSLSEAIGDLLRRKVPTVETHTGISSEEDQETSFISPLTGLRVSRGRGRTVTLEEIARMEEDDDRYHAEAGGYIWKENLPS